MKGISKTLLILFVLCLGVIVIMSFSKSTTYINYYSQDYDIFKKNKKIEMKNNHEYDNCQIFTYILDRIDTKKLCISIYTEQKEEPSFEIENFKIQGNNKIFFFTERLILSEIKKYHSEDKFGKKFFWCLMEDIEINNVKNFQVSYEIDGKQYYDLLERQVERYRDSQI